LCILLLFVSFCGVVNAQTNAADQKLIEAKTSFAQAFYAILDAEKVGSNITSLLNKLNKGSLFLADAENACRIGDTETALAKVELVLLISNQVKLEAQRLKESNIASTQSAFWSTLTLSVVGIVVLLISLFLIWRIIKRNYIKNLFNTVPEVVNDETA
jgi:hypothetical protein